MHLTRINWRQNWQVFEPPPHYLQDTANKISLFVHAKPKGFIIQVVKSHNFFTEFLRLNPLPNIACTWKKKNSKRRLLRFLLNKWWLKKSFAIKSRSYRGLIQSNMWKYFNCMSYVYYWTSYSHISYILDDTSITC